jgi:hypothetical protein
VSPQRRYALTIALFATVLFFAAAVAASGLISLYTDREVLIETDAGPLVAPVMYAAAIVALFLQLAGLSDRARRGAIVLWSLGTGVATWFVFVGTGATLYLFATGRPLSGLLFFAGNALTLFAISIAALAAAITLGYLLLIDYRAHGGAQNTPRWPWERKDERDRNDPG